MSFKNRIIGLVAAFSLLLLGMAGYLIYATHRIDNQLAHFRSTSRYLAAISSVHSGVSHQTWEVFEQLANIPEIGETAESGQVQFIQEAFDQWQQAISEQQKLGVQGENEDLELARQQLQIYREWLDKLAEIRTLLTRGKKEEAFQEFSRVLGGLFNLRLLPGLSRALDDGLLELQKAEAGLTLAIGAFPWRAEQNFRELMRIKASIDFMLAGNNVSGTFNRQSVALMKYLSNGQGKDLVEFDKLAGSMEDVLKDWSSAAMEKLRNDPENPQAPLDLTRVRGAMEAYSVILSLSEEAIEAYRGHHAGEELRLILARIGTQVDNNLLPTLAATIQTNQLDLPGGTDSLQLVGLSILAVFLLLVVLSAVLLLREMLSAMKSLRSGVAHFQAGRLDHRIVLAAEDAGFVQLADSLNEMARHLGHSQQKTDRLERSLEEKARLHALQLEEVNQELRSVHSLVSSDLCNSLAKVLGFAEALLAKARKSGRQADLEVLESLVDNARRMQLDLKGLDRLFDLPHQPPEYGDVSLSRLAGEVLEEAVEQVLGRQLEVIIEPDLHVRADPNLLWLVMKNLIQRVLEVISPEVPTRLEIGREKTLRGDAFFVRSRNLAARSGEAAGPETECRERGPDAENSRSGFSLVRRIIRHYGGEVWVEYAADSGCSSYFLLPEAGVPKREVEWENQ